MEAILQDPSPSHISINPKTTSKQKTHEISSQGCGGIQLAKSLGPGNFILWDRFLPTRGRRKGKVGEEAF